MGKAAFECEQPVTEQVVSRFSRRLGRAYIPAEPIALAPLVRLGLGDRPAQAETKSTEQSPD